MGVPARLHEQLYLMAYDRGRHRIAIYNRKLFGLALRGAMVTDLYLSGHLEDRDDSPRTAGAAMPNDELLQGLWSRISEGPNRSWCQVIAANAVKAPDAVRDRLEGSGVLGPRRRSLLHPGGGHSWATDEDMVDELSQNVNAALRNCLADAPAEPRFLAVALLGVLGQMPTVLSFDDFARNRRELHALIDATIAPITGLRQAIHEHLEDMRRGGDGFGHGPF